MSSNPIFPFSNPSNPQNSVFSINPSQKPTALFQPNALPGEAPQSIFGKPTNVFPASQPSAFSFGEKNPSLIQPQKKEASSNPFLNAQAPLMQTQGAFSIPFQAKTETSSSKQETQSAQELKSNNPEKEEEKAEEPKNEKNPEIEIESLESYKSNYKKCDDLNNILREELKAKSEEIISLKQTLTEKDKKEKEKTNEIQAKTAGLSQDAAQKDMLIAKYKAEMEELHRKKHQLSLNNFHLRSKVAILQKNLELAHENFKKKLQNHDDLLREQIKELEKQNKFEKEKFVKDVKSIKRKFKSEMTAELKQNLVEASKFQFHNADYTDNLDEIANLNQQISKKTKELEAIKDEIDFNSNSLERIKGNINTLSAYEVQKNNHFMQETYGVVLVFLLGFLAHILVGPYLGLIK
ncbi:unnamed protein product [Blepharisma stoltei]|uniref:Uncharacterized protein n=1 Tax=Blepharisma stoltei TaxID=1481888 RepID=A0AAU9IT47_9CILI|nr:unnamed protein product [Blepharisma stoltei]